MPIKIVDIPEPFTVASQLSPERPPLIESDAYRQLVHELRRYCNGEVAGRSFLIAGHRGSGKTTLVSSAFDGLLRERYLPRPSAPGEPRKTMMLRPLPVLLQGPTLLPSSTEDLPLSVDGTGKPDRQLTQMENVLVQITLALHRAVAREMVTAFRAHVSRLTMSPGMNIRELLELAAELQLELDDYMGKARLRDVWRRAGALRGGVLYALTSQPYFLHDELRVRFSADVSPDQGSRELVGLASVCDAYRRISGKISRKNETKSDITNKDEHTSELDLKGKELSGPFVALLSGAAVGAGAWAGVGNVRVGVLAGALTALLGTFSAKVSVSRKRERSASLQDLFIPDLSVATLDRILPVLLIRLRDAGLAPIFVVDELDKVEGLSMRIRDMIWRLKKLVAENACFCFLADRNYFEEMCQRTAQAPYSIEHTFFTHQLFISFRHSDVRAYLEQILGRPPEENSEEQADRAVLPYVLMHDAQLHPIDLLRQIAQLRDADGNVILGPGLVRSRPRYQLELLLQLGIELQLESEGMQEELDRRPAFRRLAHDALYYISRRWEQDEPTLQLGDGGRELFEKYLIARMAFDAAPAAAPQSSADAAVAPPANDAGKPAFVSAEDVSFLWKAVQALAESLEAPSTILTKYEERKTSEVILSAVRSAIVLGPLIERVKKSPGAYRWRFWRSGRPIEAVPTRRQAAAPSIWQTEAAVINRFADALRKATQGGIDPSTLSTGLGILPTSPAWPQVSAALSRLSSLSDEAKKTYPEKDDDELVVHAYAELMRENIRAVALSLYCGLVLTNWSKAEGDGRLRDALDRMSHVLGLHELNPTKVVDVLESLRNELASVEISGSAIERPAKDDAGPNEWIEWIGSLADWQPKLVKLLKLDETVPWDYWRSRFGIGGTQPPAMLHVVIQAVLGEGAFAVLKLPLSAMTIRDWSVAFRDAIKGDPSATPQWLALVALRMLGWQTQLNAFIQSGPQIFVRGALDAEVLRWATADHAATPLAHVLIATQEGALSESWKPTPSCGVLVLRAEEWSELFELWTKNRDAIVQAYRPDFAVVDASASRNAAKAERKRALRVETGVTGDWAGDFVDWFGRSDDAVPMIVSDPQLRLLSTNYYLILKPSSLRNLVIRLTRQQPAA